MSDAPTLASVHSADTPLVDAVFVHGLTGNPQETWANGSEDGFWPAWVGEDLHFVSVYTLGYPTSLFESWAKKEMDMFERASNTLELFAGTGIGQRPLIFVAHSLGGILTKILLRKSSGADDEGWRRVSESTKLVVFLSTPHTGATLARALEVLPFASSSIQLIADNAGFLPDLYEHYQNFATHRDDLETVSYYEKHRTGTQLVVTRESANPGVGNTVPMDRNHVDICKPTDREDTVYLGIKYHIQKVINTAQQSSSSALGLTQGEDYAERSTRDRRNLQEKLIDANREHEYSIWNEYQNRFARDFMRKGLFPTAIEERNILLSEVETRFVAHVFLPLICKSASGEIVRDAVQEKVIDPLTARSFDGKHVKAADVYGALYYLTEQCHIQWDPPP